MSRAPQRAPLTRDRVVRAGVALADDNGIEAVSMRRLAKDLGVEAMSLYNHVENKGDLVDAMVDDVVREIDLPSDQDWETAIRRCAISAYDTFLRHPWACSLVLSPGSLRLEENPRLRYMEWLLGRLEDAGFSAELTYRGYHALDSHILGFTIWQLGHSVGTEDMDIADLAAGFLRDTSANEFPYLIEHVHQHLAAGRDGATEFEYGLNLILDGLKRERSST